MSRKVRMPGAPLKRAAAVLVAVLFSGPAFGEVIWRGDFETGDLSQWDSIQAIEGRLQVVIDPVREGAYALRVEVRQGDDPISASGNRNELVKMLDCSEGQEHYYAWSTLWPDDYPLTATWQVFTQWHHPGDSGAPPVRFVMGYTGFPEYNDTMFFIVANGDVQWTHAPITRGTWHDFVLHVMWSADPDYGFVELWYDGEIIVPLTNVATLFSAADTNYLKQGLYRDETTEPTAFLYHDGMVVGTTLDDVTRPPVTPDDDEDAEAVVEPFPDLEADPEEVADTGHEGEAGEAVDLSQDGDGMPGCSEASCEQACESNGLGSGHCAGGLCVCVTATGDEGCGCAVAG